MVLDVDLDLCVVLEDAVLGLRDRICTGKATFLYATKTEKHNHAQILKAHLEAL